ncbi:tyrosine-type recombinase/integrase [Chloroflexota bacterium]
MSNHTQYTSTTTIKQAIDGFLLNCKVEGKSYGRYFSEFDPDAAQRVDIETFLIKFENPGNRHAFYRAIKTFYNWREEMFGLPSPMQHMKAPKIPKIILPTLTREQVLKLIDSANSDRDKAIISLLTESGLRLSELANIVIQDIDWNHNIIRVLGKGNKEAYAAFGDMSEKYLRK